METIEFKGNTFVVDKIVGISDVCVIKTGSAMCDWAYGFKVLLDGNTQELIYSRLHASESKQEYRDRVKVYKKKLVSIISQEKPAR